MRKIILFNMVTLDGFFEGPGGDIDWHNTDEEFNTFSTEQLRSAAGLIFGRVTYQLMESYWPTPAALQNDPQVAEHMNRLPKIVFSRTLERADWSNTRLVKVRPGANSPEEEVARLRQESGGDLYILGSANLASALTRAGLIDEYRLIVNPVVLGSGRRLFEDIDQPRKFKLAMSRPFQNGNVLLVYQPEE